jgi:glycosyltransferase involved in cell wall biosynthesis
VSKLANAKKKGNARIVVNQNGLYYPAWFRGDWRMENEYFRSLHGLADFVVFQSLFCKRAYEELVGSVTGPHSIIYNAPDLKTTPPRASAQPMSGVLFLAGIWSADAEHIFRPLLLAMNKLAGAKFRLRLAGEFTPGARSASWYPQVATRIEELRRAGVLELVGAYRPEELPGLLADVEIALHLKYNDACPNAVVERMAFGLPHVFSASGGTPELIGPGGVGITVPESWDEMQPVSAEALVEAVLAARSRHAELSSLALERQRALFSWRHYETAHKDLFCRLVQV